MPYLAHQTEERTQTVKEHLDGTERLAKAFAEAFGAGDEGAFCGRLHDIGKYSDKFQKRLNGANIRVDHSTAGAVEAFKARHCAAAMCIAGHHAGLANGGSKAAVEGTFTGRLRAKPEDYSAFHEEISVPSTPPMEAPLARDVAAAAFWTRMLYSCLVDADYLDTEAFMQEEALPRGEFAPIEDYHRKLMDKFEREHWLSEGKTGLNGLRSEILRNTVAMGGQPRGLYTFTAPTGSGKTFSSVAFALEHVRAHRAEGLRRVIYVIPYCSIIEQTQRVFEDVFGENSVVAHYANVDYHTDEDESARRDKRYLAAENWDAPLILTTNVQFFESLFANRPSRCRKLHNIADSVIVFDEAQMLPNACLQPCVYAIAELVKRFRCTAVLCTATQPVLQPIFDKWGGTKPTELCPRPQEMYEAFRRVRYESLGKLTDEALVARLTEQRQTLCVLNRKDHAQEIFEALPQEGTFHLSTALCPSDRRRILEQVRERLKTGEDKPLSERPPCRVISTSLIEAGVDVDFPTVFRELAGLDSVIQSGGRCNREGKRDRAESVTYVFECERAAPKMLAQNISSAKHAMSLHDDPAEPQAVSDYFSDLLYLSTGMDGLDAARVMKLCEDPTMPFADVAKAFHVIESVQKTVYIPTAESAPLLERLERFGASRTLMRKLGPFAVSVYPNQYEALVNNQDAKPIAEDAAVLTNAALYDAQKGLQTVAARQDGIFL